MLNIYTTARNFIFALCLCSLGVAFHATAHAAKPSKSDTLDDKCLTAYESADYALTIEACSEAIKKSPQNAVLYLKRGDAYLMEKNAFAARSDYAKAIEADPSDIEGYHKRALISFAIKKYAEAIDDYTLAIKARPDASISYYFRGLAYLEAGKPEASLKDLSDYIGMEKHGNNKDDALRLAEAYFFRALILMGQEKFDSARTDLDEAIKVNPNKADYYYERGIAGHFLKDYLGATIDFGKAVKIDPSHQKSFLQRGNTYLVLERYEEALKDFSTAIALLPEESYAYSGRATALSFLGRMDEASADSSKAVELDPANTVALLNHAELLVMAGSYKDAYGWARKASTSAENDEFRLLAAYLESISLKLVGKDTVEADRKFTELINKTSKVDWSFTIFDKWLEKTKIPKATRNYINEKSSALKKLSR